MEEMNDYLRLNIMENNINSNQQRRRKRKKNEGEAYWQSSGMEKNI